MRFDQPVGTLSERDASRAWAGAWFSAVKYAQRYTPPSGDSYHTGDDLNLPNFADVGAPVYASANGTVVTAGAIAGWGGLMVCIKHLVEGEGAIWTRYAHLERLQVSVSSGLVLRGRLIGYIGDYTPVGPANDHLHFDVARIDLGAKPSDWPRLDLARLKRDYINPQEWINTHRIDTEENMAKWTPTDATLGTRVRLAPSTTGNTNIAGVIPGNAVVDGEVSGDGQWVTVKIKPERMTVSGVVLQPSVNATFDGFASRQFMKSAVVVEPPPLPTPATHPAFETLARVNSITGMHVLNFVDDARAAWDYGCRVFTFLNAVNEAREMRNRGAVVIYRHWFNDRGWSPTTLLNAMGLGIEDRMIVVGQNECDALCYGDEAQIRERFAWDKEFAELVWQRHPSCFPAIGGFSVGTPAIDDPNIARVFRETYGAFLNANAHRVGVNWHLYVNQRVTNEWPPPSQEVHPDQRWWAGRCKYFAYSAAHGGLNANVISVSDEIGVEAGHGGMKWAGYQDVDATRWADYWRGMYEAFPELKYATVFIGARSQSWEGYDTRYLWPVSFRQTWSVGGGSAATPTQMGDTRAALAHDLTSYVSGDDDLVGRARAGDPDAIDQLMQAKD